MAASTTTTKKTTRVTIVTGLLGAGKTSFIRALIGCNTDDDDDDDDNRTTTNTSSSSSSKEDEEKKKKKRKKKSSRKEKIAVLVNEFGSLGIDGAVLEAATGKNDDDDDDDDDEGGVYVKEIAGGCVCCAASGAVPFLVAIQRVLREVKPDRLIIEPSGLAHPSGLHDMFTKNEHLKEHVDLRGMVCVVDARMISTAAKGEGGEKEEEAKSVRDSDAFRNQVSMSEVLIGSKLDLCKGEGEEDGEEVGRRRFREWAASLYPTKQLVKFTMDLFDDTASTSPFETLDSSSSLVVKEGGEEESKEKKKGGGGGIARPFQLLGLTPPVEPGAKPHVSTQDSDEYASRGFLFHADDIFRRDKLLEFFQSWCAPRTNGNEENKEETNASIRLVRAKAIVRVSDKTWVIPSFKECKDETDTTASQTKVTLEEVAYRKDSRFEVIASKNNIAASHEALKAAEREFWANIEAQVLLCRRLPPQSRLA